MLDACYSYKPHDRIYLEVSKNFSDTLWNLRTVKKERFVEGIVLENQLNFKKGKAYNTGKISVSSLIDWPLRGLSLLSQRQEGKCVRLGSCVCSSSGPLMKDLLRSAKQN